MGWIKRNLFFAVAGVLALGLLGAAGFYGYKGWARNSAAFDKLNEIYQTLHELINQKPSPGNAKINNTEAARDQEHQIREWIIQARKHFQPIAPIPKSDGGPVSSELFAAALRRTIDQLQREADAANVLLPPQYNFSFAAERPLVKFASGSLDVLPTQLGEVKAISEILFAARVNALDGVQRIRMSDDDAGGSQGDYLDDQSVTNELAVITPYTVVFRAFSPEIAQTLAGFASSPNCFVVKGVNVQPAGDASVGTSSPMGMGEQQTGYQPPMGLPSAMTPSAPGRGGLQTVLKEQLLRVTMEVELVKLLPKN
jgi:hypothetical protein